MPHNHKEISEWCLHKDTGKGRNRTQLDKASVNKERRYWAPAKPKKNKTVWVQSLRSTHPAETHPPETPGGGGGGGGSSVLNANSPSN